MHVRFKITGWSLCRYSKQNWSLFLHSEDKSKGIQYITGDSLFQVLKRLVVFLIEG